MSTPQGAGGMQASLRWLQQAGRDWCNHNWPEWAGWDQTPASAWKFSVHEKYLTGLRQRGGGGRGLRCWKLLQGGAGDQLTGWSPLSQLELWQEGAEMRCERG